MRDTFKRHGYNAIFLESLKYILEMLFYSKTREIGEMFKYNLKTFKRPPPLPPDWLFSVYGMMSCGTRPFQFLLAT